LGNVVDMLYFPLIDSTWPDWVPVFGGDRLVFFRPIFNLADAAISVGVITLLIFQQRLLQPPAEEKAGNTVLRVRYIQPASKQLLKHEQLKQASLLQRKQNKE
jgi:hypothetical protein